ncbi:chromate transporter [Gordoniibacillus kamchatkensis]|uniref:Chromate transporter n=1 Tax=Gordoniibacillus kamchatkensis TaxID=1590651 RepID=A0ABR5AH73_9BACL|nr:chromate transporter [Paenibacillus sp. VKM B-2647]KIL40376.1 chromate transporter [Paenibacillus sp. VKM B-2647]
MAKAQVKQLWEIFWTFLKIGPATFGGGYAMIPVIEKEVVGARQWVTPNEMTDVLSIAGSAPGGIGVNASAFIGYKIAGIPGAAAAVFGITLPTFMIAFILSLIFVQIEHNPKIAAALEGIHAAIVGLIIIAAFKMGKSAVFDKTTLILMIGAVVVLLTTGIHPLIVILFGLFIGIVCVSAKEKLGLQVKLEKEEASSAFVYPDYFIADGI